MSSLNVSAHSDKILISLLPPDSTNRPPCDICCIVDVSGSMGTEATVQNSSGETESHGLNLLDITKHAVKTIIHNLNDDDRLCLVSYSTNANVEFELINMTEDGKKEAGEKLDALQPTNSTNIWDGLYTGMELLRKGKIEGRNSASLLLTDGCPNVIPPEGHIAALQEYKSTYEKYPCTINTFGFGYNLDSILLNELAVEGKGVYGFIPDSAMVGTIFVNALSNILSTLGENTTFSIELENDISVENVMGGYPFTTTSWGVQVELGSLKYGQSRDLILECSDIGTTGIYATVTASYDTIEGLNVTVTGEGEERDKTLTFDSQYARSKLVDCIRAVMSSTDITEQQNIISSATQEIQSAIDSASLQDPYIADLIIDLTGQVQEAASQIKYFTKWGKHYLPSLMCAHFLQQCNNFKDPGVQHYGGVLFNQIRDIADDVFISLPPPKPSVSRRVSGSRSRNTSSYAAPVSMSSYYSNSIPCFAGKCSVLLQNNETSTVESLKKGDIVMTQSGPSKIVCVVKTLCHEGRAELVEFEGGLLITPWHPVKMEGKWTFPADISTPKILACEAVYSFVLETGHTMYIDRIECVSLAHGMKGEVVEHEYLGTEAVINDLSLMEHFSSGLIVLKPGCLVRNKSTNLITGFDRSYQLV